MPSNEPLLPKAHSQQSRTLVKPRLWFGYLPLWSECIPTNAASGTVDWTRVLQNIVAGCVIGIRQTLSAIVSATLVYTGSNVVEISDMFPFGISMMWYSTMAGSAFYALFGRLQYNTNATQEVCAILYSSMALKAAKQLADRPEVIPPTVVAIIVTGTVTTGLCSLAFGSLGLGKVMLRFPTPVSNGFLGTIGFFLVKTALQVASGVTFQFFYPQDLHAFCAPQSLGPVACLLLMVAFMRHGPGWLKAIFSRSSFIKKMAALLCQLFPLALFYIVVTILKIDFDTLSEAKWTYPAQASESFSALWTSYSIWDADFGVLVSLLPNMLSLVMMTVLCTMTGVVGIVGKFSSGPDGDPEPFDNIDYDRELSTVGMAAVVLGLTNGVVTFHRLGSSIQLRLDGGTHRLGVLSSACFVGIFFFSSIPLGHFIPKWFLGGLFMGSGLSMLENAVFSYRSLPPGQYCVTMCCILVAVFSSPFAGIGAGLSLSAILFLLDSAKTSPVSSISTGHSTVSRTLRPPWELRTLALEGDRIVILYLQGSIFFGSGVNLTEVLSDAVEVERVKYCILSFAKVPSVDASAADQLKFAVKRARESFGCTVIFCRMEKGVFEALSLAGVIRSPDKDLRIVIDHEVKDDQDEPDTSPVDDEHQPLQITPSRHSGRRRTVFKPMSAAVYDAFDHETDALDYCSDKILNDYCYEGASSTSLESYKVEYREACMTGGKLRDSVYEAMTSMPSGMLEALKPYLVQRDSLKTGTELDHANLAIYFVMQGALTIVDTLAEDSKPQAATLSVIRMKGFGGRGGHKRLRKRYPPGSIVGKVHFFLPESSKVLSPQATPQIVVSSKFGNYTEVLELTKDKLEKMPKQLVEALLKVVVGQFAEERQHTMMSGE